VRTRGGSSSRPRPRGISSDGGDPRRRSSGAGRIFRSPSCQILRTSSDLRADRDNAGRNDLPSAGSHLGKTGPAVQSKGLPPIKWHVKLMHSNYA
jgi:hypothetical protein